MRLKYHELQQLRTNWRAARLAEYFSLPCARVYTHTRDGLYTRTRSKKKIPQHHRQRGAAAGFGFNISSIIIVATLMLVMTGAVHSAPKFTTTMPFSMSLSNRSLAMTAHATTLLVPTATNARPQCAMFYARLARFTGVPAHRSAKKRGHAWPSHDGVTFHHLIVLPYVGSFEPHACPRHTHYDRPIPRIFVNHFTVGNDLPTQAQRRQWFGDRGHGAQSQARLELTVTIEQLPDFAEWVAAWVQGRDANNPSLLPPAPYTLERGWGDQPLDSDYLWSQAAADEYEQALATQALKRHNERCRARRTNISTSAAHRHVTQERPAVGLYGETTTRCDRESTEVTHASDANVPPLAQTTAGALQQLATHESVQGDQRYRPCSPPSPRVGPCGEAAKRGEVWSTAAQDATGANVARSCSYPQSASVAVDNSARATASAVPPCAESQETAVGTAASNDSLSFV